MLKTLKTILIISVACLGVSFLLASPVQANGDISVEVWDEGASEFFPLAGNPIFDEAGFMPGQDVTRWVKVTNNSGQPQRIATEVINYPGFPDPEAVPSNDLSRALSIIIGEKGGNALYGGSSPTGAKTLFSFYQDGETYLSYLSTDEAKEYEFEITFSAEEENERQGATTSFDILIGFQGTGGKVPPGEGGGGSVLPPGLTIQYEKDMWVGTTTAKISWLTTYESTSRVIYDVTLGVFDLDSLPNYGYSYSTSEFDTPAGTNGVTYHEVTLTGLTAGTTYHYRCISHASPPTISREHVFTTLGTKIEEETEEEAPSGEMPPAEEEEEEEEELPGQIVLAPIGEGEIKEPSEGGLIEREEGIGEETETEAEEEAEESEEKLAVGEPEEKEEAGRFLAGIGGFFSGYTLRSIGAILLIVVIVLLIWLLLALRKEKKKSKNY